MDALSKIFDDIHLAKTEYLYLKLFQPNSFEYVHEPTMMAYVILHGQATFVFEDQTELQTQQGDLVLLPAGQSHRVYIDAISTLSAPYTINADFKTHAQQCLNIGSEMQNPHSFILVIRAELDIQMARPLIGALPSYLHTQHILSDTAPEWLQIGLQFLALENQQIRPGRDKILDHLVSILLIECVRDYILNLDNASSWLNALSHPELSNALAAIHGQPEHPWTVELLAETCHMSRSKFAQLFNHIVGDPPLAYLHQHRLRLAAQYLRNGGFNVQQIAHWVGYSSETAFSQSFKKQFELTPSQYRQLFQCK